MSLVAFTGAAGMGKTFQLMRRLESTLEAFPLSDGQKVLALTFMHGSRRRLDEPTFQCATIAWPAPPYSNAIPSARSTGTPRATSSTAAPFVSTNIV
jgi:hypothetical protein